MLRISAYELQHRIDVPYRVIIDEALKAVKRFGSEHGHTYVNGVLDNAAAEWRALEMQAARGKCAAVPRFRACKQREAVSGAAHPLLMLPLRPFGLRAQRGDWCRGCANQLNVLGLFAWELLALELRSARSWRGCSAC